MKLPGVKRRPRPDVPGVAERRLRNMQTMQVLDYAETSTVGAGRNLDHIRSGTLPSDVAIPEAVRAAETLYGALMELQRRMTEGTL